MSGCPIQQPLRQHLPANCGGFSRLQFCADPKNNKIMMMKGLVLALLCVSARAAPEEDRVTELPGYTGESAQPPSTHYSGYVRTGETRGVPGALHYWLIESEGDPKTDPIVMWLNGGPMSSSLIGLLTEMGQVQTNDKSLENVSAGEVPKVFYNPYSWSTPATYFAVEQPMGVGFSYCDDGKDACTHTDTSMGIDMEEFLYNLFEKFPEYKKNDFYITGESYGCVQPRARQRLSPALL